MYQAIFTDGYELQRFDPKKRLRPVVVKFDDLEKFLVKDAKGFLLNRPVLPCRFAVSSCLLSKNVLMVN